jgi:predicted metal-binding protein
VQPVRLLPKVHLFVCANRREDASPLGPGCAADGDALYDALKDEVARRGAVRSVWVTKTHCLGICPKTGATVATYPAARIWAGAMVSDIATLFRESGAEAAGAP